MPQIPVNYCKFAPNNQWGVVDGSDEMHVSLAQLVHAAITVGHGLGWRTRMNSSNESYFECIWKLTPLLVCLEQKLIGRIERFEKTRHFANMDPSEKQGMGYHLGMTLALAWARDKLRVPWLLHLDVYWDFLRIAISRTSKRPDLVGMDHQGVRVALECKGRSTRPDAKSIRSAKVQSQRVAQIGVHPVSLNVAFFAYFDLDRSSSLRPKPKIWKAHVEDPAPLPEGEGTIDLGTLSDDLFFELYYGPIVPLFLVDEIKVKAEGMTWRKLEDVDIEIGIVTELLEGLAQKKYHDVVKHSKVAPEEMKEAVRSGEVWAGDGLHVRLGESWNQIDS